MVFQGISKVFSTVNDRQYETIGAFWDALSGAYGMESLRGLGFHWTEHTIEYVIGFKEGVIPGCDCSVELPDQGWTTVRGKTENLGKIYEAIYLDGPLTYEIESFTEQGDCEIWYWRPAKKSGYREKQRE